MEVSDQFLAPVALPPVLTVPSIIKSTSSTGQQKNLSRNKYSANAFYVNLNYANFN
jgi:hypothetical protein